MKVLLDTCTFLYLTLEPEKLSVNAVNIIEDPYIDLYLSSVSVWEICQKYYLKKLHLIKPPEESVDFFFQQYEMKELVFKNQDAFKLGALAPVHKDPFDRMIICQAMNSGLPVVTDDITFSNYPIKVLW